MTVILSKGIQLYSWSTKSCLMNILTLDTVSTLVLINNCKLWYLNVYIRRSQMLSGKLKGMVSAEKNTDFGYIC
jgi:hypothetical protein